MISSEFTELKQNCECQNSTCFFVASHLHVSERSQNGFVACHIFQLYKPDNSYNSDTFHLRDEIFSPLLIGTLLFKFL